MTYGMFDGSLSENGDRSERTWGRASFCARMRKILGISDEFVRKKWPASTFAHDCMDAGGTNPWMGEGRTMQEQLSRATQEQLPSRLAILGQAPRLNGRG